MRDESSVFHMIMTPLRNVRARLWSWFGLGLVLCKGMVRQLSHVGSILSAVLISVALSLCDDAPPTRKRELC